jgi:hypothetical protein
MHRKYESEGLVALSVCLDDVNDKEIRVEVDEFLTKKQATLTNLIGEGKPEEWLEKLNVAAVPCVYVFDRENRTVKKLTGEAVDYKVIESEVVKLLKK